MSLEFNIAKRYFTSRHRQGYISFLGFLSIAVVTLSTASLLIVLSVMNGFEMEVRNRIIGTMAHIMVQPRLFDSIEDWQTLREKIGEIDDVVATSPVIIEKSAISSRLSVMVLRMVFFSELLVSPFLFTVASVSISITSFIIDSLPILSIF